MGEFVGVLRLTDYEGQLMEPLPSLKREALFFDRLAVPGLHSVLSRGDLDPAIAADLQWLMERQIVWEPRVVYEELGRAPILTLYHTRMMMATIPDANTCLWLGQHGYEAVTVANSHADLAERFHFDLDPNERMMAEMIAQAAATMNAGNGQGTCVHQRQDDRHPGCARRATTCASSPRY